MNSSFLPGRRHCLGLLAGAFAAPHALAQPGDTALARIRQRGSLQVALYQDMPPFHANGSGIDVELARALAERLGVSLSLMPFNAGDDMGDDLRNAVWRGHYLGWGPADVLMHVPVDRPLMEANPRVQILAPYYRESVALAWDRKALPRGVESLAELRGVPTAVAGQSLAGWLLIGAEDGALRESLRTTWPDGTAAAQALKSGGVGAAAGLQSELESVLVGDDRFVIAPLPSPRAPRSGWAVGLAVKKESGELALALQQAMSDLAASSRLQAAFAAQHVRWRL